MKHFIDLALNTDRDVSRYVAATAVATDHVIIC